MKLQKYEAMIGPEESTVEYRGSYCGADFWFNQYAAEWGTRRKENVLNIIDTVEIDDDDISSVIEFIKAKKYMIEVADKLDWKYKELR